MARPSCKLGLANKVPSKIASIKLGQRVYLEAWLRALQERPLYIFALLAISLSLVALIMPANLLVL